MPYQELCTTLNNFSETHGPVFFKFHVVFSFKRGLKIYANDHGPLSKMATLTTLLLQLLICDLCSYLQPGKKKKFINKKEAVSFHLVHRSQKDPLQASEEASKHVLVPGSGNVCKSESLLILVMLNKLRSS